MESLFIETHSCICIHCDTEFERTGTPYLCNDCIRILNTEVIEYDNDDYHCMACFTNNIKSNDLLYVINPNNYLASYGFQPFFVERCSECKDNRCSIHACLNIGCATCINVNSFPHDEYAPAIKEHFLNWFNRLKHGEAEPAEAEPAEAEPAEAEPAYFTEADLDVYSGLTDSSDEDADDTSTTSTNSGDFHAGVVPMARMLMEADGRANHAKYEMAAAASRAAHAQRKAAELANAKDDAERADIITRRKAAEDERERERTEMRNFITMADARDKAEREARANAKREARAKREAFANACVKPASFEVEAVPVEVEAASVEVEAVPVEADDEYESDARYYDARYYDDDSDDDRYDDDFEIDSDPGLSGEPYERVGISHGY